MMPWRQTAASFVLLIPATHCHLLVARFFPPATASLASVEEEKPRVTDYLGSKGTFLDLVASPPSPTDKEIL